MKYGRVFNFSAGPANLPEPVLEQVRDEMLNFKGSGMSVMEMSHRSKPDEIMAHALATAKELLGLGDSHEVLFLQGGASLQFAMAPMNLAQHFKPIDVMHTGYWSELAIKELKKGGFAHRLVFDGTKDKFTKIPEIHSDALNPNASYVYTCSNNTIEGTQIKTFPKTGNVPLVSDMSSDFMSRKLDYSQFGLIFAGAQKNLGPSGVTMAIIRKDLAELADEKLPTMLQYRTHVKGGSRYNTPPAFSIYVCGLVMEWIKKNGGLEGLEKANQKKAQMLYDAIDTSGGFYSSPVDKSVRSPMNVVWRVKGGDEAVEETFVKEAKAAGLLELKGHRAVGGIRASIYNAHPMEGVAALTQFMREFQKKNA